MEDDENKSLEVIKYRLTKHLSQHSKSVSRIGARSVLWVKYISLLYIRGQLRYKFECKRDSFWVRFPFEEMKYLIFSFLRSGNESKR